jgi:Ca-activated chloride channel family protein
MEATARRIELVTRGGAADKVALRGVHLKARLSGMSQRTTLEQTFVNLESKAIEALYTFPLPEGAAVCEFQVIAGDRVLTGEVDEAEAAAEKYDNAISQGHAAFALEQERPDVFTVRVGNLEPSQAATIRITYICPLERVDKAIRIAFPTTIAPRYVSGAGMDTLTAAIDGNALNPPHVLSVPYGLSIDVEIDLGRELAGVTSPTHEINVSTSESGTTHVAFTGGIAEMDRDVVLVLATKKEAEPCVQVGRGPGGASYLAVTFVPEFEIDDLADPAPTETVFVLDCSGSMQGESISQATTALELCLRSLSAGDRFNICRFGSRFELMSSEPVAYSEESLARAIAYVRRGADLGGTELFAPLQAVLAAPPSVGAVRQIILLSDGQVSNEPAIIQLARSRRAHNRIFSFGIGTACSAHLVRGVARATGGAAEFISGAERIDEKVLRTFGRMASPQLTDVCVDWDGCDVQTLAELPPVFDGDILALYGRAEGRTPREVTLRATTATGSRKWRVEVPAPTDDANTIATMWARRTLQSLEEVNGVGVSRVRRQKQSREAERMIRISKDFGLLCTLTSFVAVEHRSEADRNEGRPALRRVPLKLAAGWGGVDTGDVACALFGAVGLAADRSYDSKIKKCASGTAMRYRLAPPAQAPAAAAGGADHLIDRSAAEDEGLLDLSRKRDDEVDREALSSDDSAVLEEISPSHTTLDRTVDYIPRGPVEAKRVLKPADDLLSLLAQQAADGSFLHSEVLFRILTESRSTGVDWKQIVESHLPPTALASDRSSVVITTITILLFTIRFSTREPAWRRAYRKASRVYLSKVLGKTPAEVEAWLQELKTAGAVTH